MGTDVRKLVQDGYPATQIIASDLRPEFIDLGLDKLYRDRDTCHITFFAGDIFDLKLLPASQNITRDNTKLTKPLSQCSSFEDVVGRVSVIYTGALFHLFRKETQIALARRLAYILKKEKGAVIFGRHQGRQEEGYIDDSLNRSVTPSFPIQQQHKLKMSFVTPERVTGHDTDIRLRRSRSFGKIFSEIWRVTRSQMTVLM